MTDRDFDLLLQESISELPPSDDLVEDITPWRKATNRILWGMGLVTVTLNFLNLDTILPAIGMILMVLGYRALRNENGWFRLGYYLAILRTLWLLVHIFFDATIYSGDFAASNLSVTGQYAMVPIGFLHLLCLRGGIRAVQKKAGMDPHGGNAILMFYTIIALLAFVNFQGFTVWILLIAYIFILRGLFKLSKELDDAGYAITAAPPRISDLVLTVIYTAVIALLLGVGYLCFSQYPMEWTVREESAADAAEVRQELLNLGFPEYVLNDLTEEDILTCQGAVKVVVDARDYTLEGGSSVQVTDDGSYPYSTVTFSADLRITGVGVQLPDEAGSLMIFHHFLWLNDSAYRGTEALQFWPTYRLEGWSKSTDFAGRVLCDLDGTSFVSPYYSLGESTYSYNSVFWGNTTSTDVFAIFSMPRKAQNCRGYVRYGVRVAVPGYIIDSWCNYFYQKTPLQYPVRTAEDFARSGAFSLSGSAFGQRQTALQGYSKADAENGIYDYELFD